MSNSGRGASSQEEFWPAARCTYLGHGGSVGGGREERVVRGRGAGVGADGSEASRVEVGRGSGGRNAPRA